jgi:hypothetical protein
VQPVYTATQRLIREFEQEFGARNCNITEYTSKAAEIAARIISETT